MSKLKRSANASIQEIPAATRSCAKARGLRQFGLRRFINRDMIFPKAPDRQAEQDIKCGHYDENDGLGLWRTADGGKSGHCASQHQTNLGLRRFTVRSEERRGGKEWWCPRARG